MKYLYSFLLIFIMVSSRVAYAQPNRIPIFNGEKQVFFSGVNLAWGINSDGSANFGRDVITLPDYSFPKILDEIKAGGGNSMRWWLHTNGRFSPDFDSQGKVTGLHAQTIPNMKKVLDMAYERGIMISMCLWSFDMLQPQGQNQQHMKALLEDSSLTSTYIKNALIPILKEIGNHPAVMTWEVFNEPEGMTTQFGWTPVKTDMRYVQQFTNLIAGAIHRIAPGALVSNGSWSFKAMTDVGGNKNYYRDDRLIAAGGDPEGTLDFYQIHYYPQHFGNDLSPFHNPSSYWKLDKPIVIGEFPIKGLDQKADPHKTTKEAYVYAYENGYAGCLAWSWTDNTKTLVPATEGMALLWQNHKSELEIPYDPDYNFAPKVIEKIPDIKTKKGTGKATGYIDLKDIFFDDKDGSHLEYSLESNSNAGLANVSIDEFDKVNIEFGLESVGSGVVTIKATDQGGKSSSTSFSITISDLDGNLATNKKATASSTFSSEFNAESITDENFSTGWSSKYRDSEWIYIDLESLQAFDKVVLSWNNGYAKEYSIQYSADGSNWQILKAVNNGAGGTEEISLPYTLGRYVRLNGLKRATELGYSLSEFEIYLSDPNAVEEKVGSFIKIYPNPSNDLIIIDTNYTSSPQYIQLVDARGKVMVKKNYHFKSNQNSFNLNSYPRGIYFFQLMFKERIIVRKIFKS